MVVTMFVTGRSCRMTVPVPACLSAPPLTACFGHGFVRFRRQKPALECANSGPSTEWLLMNDCRARKVTVQEVLSCQAYMLFYERSGRCA